MSFWGFFQIFSYAFHQDCYKKDVLWPHSGCRQFCAWMSSTCVSTHSRLGISECSFRPSCATTVPDFWWGHFNTTNSFKYETLVAQQKHEAKTMQGQMHWWNCGHTYPLNLLIGAFFASANICNSFRLIIQKDIIRLIYSITSGHDGHKRHCIKPWLLWRRLIIEKGNKRRQWKPESAEMEVEIQGVREVSLPCHFEIDAGWLQYETRFATTCKIIYSFLS